MINSRHYLTKMDKKFRKFGNTGLCDKTDFSLWSSSRKIPHKKSRFEISDLSSEATPQHFLLFLVLNELYVSGSRSAHTHTHTRHITHSEQLESRRAAMSCSSVSVVLRSARRPPAFTALKGWVQPSRWSFSCGLVALSWMTTSHPVERKSQVTAVRRLWNWNYSLIWTCSI